MKYLTLLIFICTTVIFPTFSQDTINVPSDYTTIQAAIDAAADGDLVLVAENTYYENINFSGKAIIVASHFLIDGDISHISNTIIDGSQPTNPNAASVVRFAAGEDTSSVICGFTIKGGFGTIWFTNFRVGGGIYIDNASPIIRNNIIELNELVSDNKYVWGSALFVITATHKAVKIENNIIRNNLAQTTSAALFAAGTIFVYPEYTTVGGVKIYNNIISDNVIQGGQGPRGGAIAVMYSDNPDFNMNIENNKIFRNEASSTTSLGVGGGMHLVDVQAEVKNNIIAYNSAGWGASIAYGSLATSPQCTTVVANNTIYGNSGTVSAISTKKYYETINCIIWGNSSPLYDTTHAAYITYTVIEDSSYSNGSNNISLNPEFTDTINFYLDSLLSPCIDMGNPDPIYDDIQDPSNPGFALWPAMGTVRNDMGVYGGPYADIVVGIDDEGLDNIKLPTEFELSQNYPNPFNPTTKIRFSIPEAGITTLKVYDILGREIASLVNEEKTVGTYELTWYAESLPSGVYFYQIKAGEFVETKKMVLVK